MVVYPEDLYSAYHDSLHSQQKVSNIFYFLPEAYEPMKHPT